MRPAGATQVRDAALAGLAFVSGAAALIFETLWFHQAGLALGNSVWAASLVLSAFMAGLALGSWLGARKADRLVAPFRAYAWLELAVAIGGAALVFLLPGFGTALAPALGSLADVPWLLGALRFAIAFVWLLVPATAMGMTLPVLVRARAAPLEGARPALLEGARLARDTSFGPALGLLYGANTLGAVVGCVSAETLLLGTLGIHGSALAAAGLNVVAAGFALLLARVAQVAAPPPAAPRVESVADRYAMPWLIAAFMAGFALLALEVVWLRFLLLFLNDTPLAFALILAVVLVGIALGGLIASAWCALSSRARLQPARAAAVVAHAAGVFGLGGYLLYPWLMQHTFEPEQHAGTVATIAAGLMLPTSLASGALFTLLGAGLRDASASDAHTAGRLALHNTIGAALGSLSAGLLLLPWLGMERALFALFASYGVTGALLLSRCQLSSWWRYGASTAFVVALSAFPFGAVRASYVETSARRWMAGGGRIAAVREGQTGTLIHIVHARHGLPVFDQLATNAYSMSVNDFAARRYMDLFAALPAALHPRIQNALLIGYGIGNTAQALLANRDVLRADVVDISRDILALGRAITPPGGKHPLADPRVRVHIEDGRQFLAATERRYDLITGEPPPPVMAGVVNLYTREYFELVRARLSEGGIASYWLPMMNISADTGKALIRAFCDAFDDCSLWHGSARNFILLGSRGAGAGAPVSDAQFARAFADPARRSELQAIGVELPEQLGPLFIGDATYLHELTAGSAPLSDDWPQRMHLPGTTADRDALIWSWRDTAAARARFGASALITRLFPAETRRASLRQFENQRLLNDLLFPEQTPARQTQVLHQVLRGTPLRLPVLLILGSDPDIQRALAAAPATIRERPEWRAHRLAGLLADRNYRAAFRAAVPMTDAELPLSDLRAYLEYASQMAVAGRAP